MGNWWTLLPGTLDTILFYFYVTDTQINSMIFENSNAKELNFDLQSTLATPQSILIKYRDSIFIEI